MNEKNKLLFVVSSPYALNNFLKPHIVCLAKDFEIHICVNLKLYEIDPSLNDIALIYDVPIMRKISPIKDIFSFWKLILVFIAVKPVLVQSITQKAGLLAMVSGWLCMTPHRWHTFTGQYWENKTGIFRHVLKNADRILALFATKLTTDSQSQADFLKSNKIAFGKNISVFGDGSIVGVNLDKFRPDREFREKFRTQNNISQDQIIFLFLGRLAREKGVFDLLMAFKKTLLTATKNSNPELWFVGPDEENIKADLISSFVDVSNKVKFWGRTENPEHYLKVADVICLPSYREGFGSVIIEAGACGLPSIGYKINGLVDSVSDRSTGLLVEPQNVEHFSKAMTFLLNNKRDRLLLGSNARNYAVEKFSQDKITSLYRESVFQSLNLRTG